MKGFLRFYAWGVEMKLYMSIYTVALIFFQCLTEALQGRFAVSIWTMLDMLMTSMALSMIQYVLLPAGEWGNGKRVAVWLVCANVLYLGGAALFGWFPGVPVWGRIVLVLIVEGGLAAVWFGERVARWRDTRALNRSLRKFQEGA